MPNKPPWDLLCRGLDDDELRFEGKVCAGCTIDFGSVIVGLQEHRRVDLFPGCRSTERPSAAAEFSEAPNAAGFSIVEQQVHSSPATSVRRHRFHAFDGGPRFDSASLACGRIDPARLTALAVSP